MRDQLLQQQKMNEIDMSGVIAACQLDRLDHDARHPGSRQNKEAAEFYRESRSRSLPPGDNDEQDDFGTTDPTDYNRSRVGPPVPGDSTP
ncbi:hypothetical protein E4U56_006599, partial [Claviceps arundinis]